MTWATIVRGTVLIAVFSIFFEAYVSRRPSPPLNCSSVALKSTLVGKELNSYKDLAPLIQRIYIYPYVLFAGDSVVRSGERFFEQKPKGCNGLLGQAYVWLLWLVFICLLGFCLRLIARALAHARNLATRKRGRFQLVGGRLSIVDWSNVWFITAIALMFGIYSVASTMRSATSQSSRVTGAESKRGTVKANPAAGVVVAPQVTEQAIEPIISPNANKGEVEVTQDTRSDGSGGAGRTQEKQKNRDQSMTGF